MWFFLIRRLRMWLLLTVLVPLAGGVLRRVARALEQRNGPSAVSTALHRGADLGDRVRYGSRGGGRRRSPESPGRAIRAVALRSRDGDPGQVRAGTETPTPPRVCAP